MRAYIVGVLIGVDILANALIGGEPYTTISCRVGESILDGGWASQVPWPAWLRAHFVNAVYQTTV